MDVQALVDGMSARWQKERAATQMTLGALIGALKELDSALLVKGFGDPGSYRGYYCDLSFEPSEETQTVATLLERAKECMGEEFEGYKGGEFVMGKNTPLWIASYGTTGERLMGLTAGNGFITPVTAPDED